MTLERALQYAAQGIPVFPCHPATRRPLTSHGFKDASTDPEDVRAMWREGALLGVPTGEASGLFVVDLDMKNGVNGIVAFETVQGVRDPGQPIRYTTMSGGGQHWCYQYREGLKCTRGALASGVDTRGSGGYVVLHKDIDFSALAPIPDWLYTACLKAQGPKTVNVSNEAVAAEQVPLDKRRKATADDLHALATALERSERARDRFAAADIRAVLAGEPWGRPGGREQALFSTGLAIFRALPDLEHGSLAELFQASCTAVGIADGNTNTTVGWVRAKMAHCDREAARGRAVVKSGELDQRPEIFLSFREDEVGAKVVDVLAQDEELFQRNGKLVALVDDPSQESVGKVITQLEQPQLRARITGAVKCMGYKNTKEGPVAVQVRPEEWLIKNVFAGPWKPIRPIVGVLSSPTIREDGSLLVEEGYDPATMLYLVDSIPVNVPVAPTQAQAIAARDRLLDVVQDFPFADDVDVSVWLALLLTRIGRKAVKGQVPVFVIDASTAGAGKTLLGEIACLIATGMKPHLTVPTEDQDELRKALLAIATEGRDCIFFDNVPSTGKFGGAVLDQAVTAGGISGRLLGATKTVQGDLRVTWIATGNNVTIAGDGHRRAVWCRLLPDTARPENRTGFAHPDVLDYVLEHRSELLTAALTILRAFHGAGRPKLAKRLGSFEGWSDLIASACVWVGLPDPALSQMQARGESVTDIAQQTLCELILELQDKSPRGCTIGELMKHYDRLSESLEAAVEGRSPGGKLTTNQIGCLLRGWRDKAVDIRGRTCRLKSVPGPDNLRFWKLDNI